MNTVHAIDWDMMRATPEALHYQKNAIRIAEIKRLVRMYCIERLEWGISPQR